MSAEKLTKRQAAFVKAYIATGGTNATQAAITAGYSVAKGKAGPATQAHALLQLPHILEAIRKETERCLQAGVALGANVLYELASDGKSESVRLQAAQALLDRGGMQLATLSQHTVTIEDKRTDDELRARVEQLQRELGLTAKVIPGEVVPPPQIEKRLDVSDAVLVEADK